MKAFPKVLLTVFCVLVSCEKAKEIAGRINKKPATEATATADSDIKKLPEHKPADGEENSETPQPSPKPMPKDWLPPGMKRR